MVDSSYILALDIDIEGPQKTIPMCQCVGKHIPKPMELHKHHVWPISEGGPDTRSNLVLLCPTTHQNVHRLWGLYERWEGRPPWYLINKYSEYARGIVERGREARRRAGAEPRNQSLASAIPITSNTTTIQEAIALSNEERDGVGA